MAILQYDRERGFYVGGINGNDFRDRWGVIHARQVHQSFYDPERLGLSRMGIDYLLPIFNNALERTTWSTFGKACFAAATWPSPIIRSTSISTSGFAIWIESARVGQRGELKSQSGPRGN